MSQKSNAPIITFGKWEGVWGSSNVPGAMYSDKNIYANGICVGYIRNYGGDYHVTFSGDDWVQRFRKEHRAEAYSRRILMQRVHNDSAAAAPSETEQDGKQAK